MEIEINRCSIQLVENVASAVGPFELGKYVTTVVIDKYYKTNIKSNVISSNIISQAI